MRMAHTHTHTHALHVVPQSQYNILQAQHVTHTHPLQVNLLKQPSSEDSGSSELEEQLSALGELFESDLDSAEEPVCE